MNKNNFTQIVFPFSITSRERIEKLYDLLERIRIDNIDGDLVECGVYRGGNILGMMEYCDFYNLNKTIWIYDTFCGMTQPSDLDIDVHKRKAIDQFDRIKCYASLSEVQKNLSSSSYKNIRYVVGDVCETLKNDTPAKISLLRLDTDWYESTKCELEILFPKVTNGGSLIVDDYGHWQGARLAFDEYFTNTNYTHKKIDNTGIYLTKEV